MKVKIAGLQQHIPWREQIALNESDALSEEDGWLDELLEFLEEGGGGAAAPMMRVQTPIPQFRRHGEAPKTAARESGDEDFARMQAHARNVMANLGNLR